MSDVISRDDLVAGLRKANAAQVLRINQLERAREENVRLRRRIKDLERLVGPGTLDAAAEIEA